jgi:TonB family protein
MISVLLDSLWQGALVVAVAAGFTAIVPQRHAATRYAVWFASLIALALVPLSGRFSFGNYASAIPGSVIRVTGAAAHATHQAASTDAGWLAAVWIAGVSVCLLRLALCQIRIARILQFAAPAPEFGDRVVLSSRISIPIAAGLTKPCVVLPERLVATIDPIDLESIVAHERAHIERRDILGNIVQRLFESVLFFNPWAYVIGRQLVKEREAACDDRAVNAANDPERYASCLASLALRTARAASPLLTPSAMGSGRMLVDRIARLLNGKVAELKTNYIVVAAACALFALVALGIQTPRSLASTAGANCSAGVKMIDAVPPDIPEADLKAHAHAQVTMLVTVTAGGHASDIELVKSSGDAAIDHAVARAAAKSTYKPEIRNCKAVSGGKYFFHVDTSP